MLNQNSEISQYFNVDLEIRWNHFEKLCRRERTTEIVDENDLIRIRRFIYFNVNVPDPGFRKKFLTSIKYVLIQLKESGYSIFTLLSRNDSDLTEEEDRNYRETLNRYRNAIKWLCDFSFYCLRLRGNYARRASALGVLDLIHCSAILKDELRNPYVKTWNLDESWTPVNVKELVLCLADPYESNQASALPILKSIPDEFLFFVDWKSLVETAFEWCSASKTLYPDIAVYYFLFALHRIELVPFMPRSTDAVENIEFTILGWNLADHWTRTNRNCIALCHRLLSSLQKATALMERDLVQASTDLSPWGLLRCILYVLKEVNWPFTLSNSHNSSEWASFSKRLLSLCHRLTAATAPIVNSSSPEGYLPMDLVKIDPNAKYFRDQGFTSTMNGDSNSKNEGGSVINYERWHHATCQAVLVCSWRTHKEVSAMMGYLVSLQHPRSLLDLDDVERIGDYFLVQLTECMHRGAFECAYAAFVDGCSAAWKSPSDSIRKLPAAWLRKIVDGLVTMANGGDDGGIKYCATRRSAGVPFLIQAVLATEPRKKSDSGSTLLYETLEKLLRILFDEEGENEDHKSTAKVHSLNILKALVKEAKLGLSCLTPDWLSLIAQADLLAITHRSWAVRNSATLLFSVWIVRIFGVPRKRHEISSKNRMSATDFESSCPDLLDFMADHLRRYSARTSSGSTTMFHEMMLFPILSILDRLHPSSSPNSVLRQFVPYVRDIVLTCPIITVRRSAANALCSVMDAELMQEMLRTLEQSAQAEQQPQNAIHGLLLLVNQLCSMDSKDCRKISVVDLRHKLCPFNVALYLSQGTEIQTGTKSELINRLLADLKKEDRFGNTAFGPLARFLLVQQTDGYSDVLLDWCKTNSRFRSAFYKQWRSVLKNGKARDGDGERMTDLAIQLYRTDLVWQDIVGDHDDYFLRKQACKFHLRLPKSFAYHDGDRRTSDALQLFETSEEAILRRLYFRLACHLFAHNPINPETSQRIMHELDAFSKPTSPLDDRLLVVDCLEILDLEFLTENHSRVLVMLIRLLTDLEDIVQSETTALFWKKFENREQNMQSGLALFVCVGKLIDIEGGTEAVRGYLIEALEEYEKTKEDNATGERVFDKNESNYNAEPLLIAEWLRILGNHQLRTNIERDGDLLEMIDSCLITDGLRFVDDAGELLEGDCSQILNRLLRRDR